MDKKWLPIFSISIILLVSCCGCLDFFGGDGETTTTPIKQNVSVQKAKPLIVGYQLANHLEINPGSQYPFADLARKYSVSKVEYVEVKKDNKTICYNYIYHFFNEDTLKQFYEEVSKEVNGQDYYILGEPCKKGVYNNHTVYVVGIIGCKILASSNKGEPNYIPEECSVVLSIKGDNITEGEFYKGTSYLNLIIRKSYIEKFGGYKVVESNKIYKDAESMINFYKSLFGANSE